ncbi:hypothetical protein CR513_00753, partial [Mucuna pruriens]
MLQVPISKWQIFISKDVLFNEHKFPYSFPSSKLSIQPTSTPPKSTSLPLFMLPQSPTATPTSTTASPVINSSPTPTSPSHSIQQSLFLTLHHSLLLPKTILHQLQALILVGCKWVFRIKQNLDGSIQKHKARLVAKGFHQQPGFDFQETFSPVVKLVTVRTVLSITITRHWHIKQIDVNNAFLNGILVEEFERLTTSLVALGFKNSKCNSFLFTFSLGPHQVIMLVYEDDIIVTSDHLPLIQSLISCLNDQFSLKQLGNLKYFIGIEFQKLTNGSVFLSQTKYIRDLLSKAKMTDAKGMSTPIVANIKLSKHGADYFADPSFYHPIVGALQYATIARSEISYAVHKACRFLPQPLDSYWTAMKRILRYLNGSLHHGLLILPHQLRPFLS